MKLQIGNHRDINNMITDTSLKLTAENKEEKIQLEAFKDQIQKTHLEAMPYKIAGTGNSVGSSGDSEGTRSLVIQVILGSLPLDKEVDMEILSHLNEAIRLVEVHTGD